MSEKVNKIDFMILIPIIILIALSLGVVYSASSSWSILKKGDSSIMFKNHLWKVAIGIFFLFLFSRIDYNYLKKFRKYIVIAGLGTLAYVLIFKMIIHGASRWIFLGGYSFQPAEFAKFALIVNIAYLLVRKKDYIKSFYYSYLPLITHVLLIVVLIASQPKFSTALLVLVTSVMLFLIAGVQIKHILFTGLFLLPVTGFYALSTGYIRERLFDYKQQTVGEDSVYQVVQAIIAFGNGGFFGVGPGKSIQKELFLPQSYDDFIFSIVGEEYGFVGVTLVIVMFGLFIYRGLKLSKLVEDEFAKYLSFGITIIIGLHAVVNMLVATGIIPTTGVTLPFISYGGTSLIFNSIAVGILLNISTQRNKPIGAVLNGVDSKT
jgi:cell division protein FtsW